MVRNFLLITKFSTKYWLYGKGFVSNLTLTLIKGGSTVRVRYVLKVGYDTPPFLIRSTVRLYGTVLRYLNLSTKPT